MLWTSEIGIDEIFSRYIQNKWAKTPALLYVWKGVLWSPLGDPTSHLFASSVVECVHLMCLHWALTFTWAALQAGMCFQQHTAIDSDYIMPVALLPIALCVYRGKKRKENNREIHMLEENEAESYLINLFTREGEREACSLKHMHLLSPVCVLKQWDGTVASSKAASQELCSLQTSIWECNYQSCPGKELKLSMPWQSLCPISHGGSGQANSRSEHLWRGLYVGSPFWKLKLSSI